MKNRLQRSLKVTFLGIGVNLLLAAGKIAAGVAGHSYALIADGVESLSDLFSSVIVWRGLVIASEPADDQHPYGHGKAEPLAAAMVAAMLLLAALGISIQAVREIITPHHGPAPFTLIVLLVVVLIKEILYRIVLREGHTVHSTVVCADAWHHRSDAITSLAAAIGISVALIGGEQYEKADDIAAIVAAGLIFWNGWGLLRGALNELMDSAPSEETFSEIRRVAQSVDQVAGIEKCMVRKMGYQYFVDLHVEVDPEMTVQVGHEIAHRVKDQVMLRMPQVIDVLVHIEPAPVKTPAALPFHQKS